MAIVGMISVCRKNVVEPQPDCLLWALRFFIKHPTDEQLKKSCCTDPFADLSKLKLLSDPYSDL